MRATRLEVAGGSFHLRRAVHGDVRELVALLADDVLGVHRETASATRYTEAFERIDADPGQLLVAVRDAEGTLAGTMQLSLIPGLSRGGSTRLQIEAVRMAASVRGSGLGSAMLNWAHEYGRANGATIAQLTTDKQRAEAHRFYQRLGYVASHEGFKLPL